MHNTNFDYNTITTHMHNTNFVYTITFSTLYLLELRLNYSCSYMQLDVS